MEVFFISVNFLEIKSPHVTLEWQSFLSLLRFCTDELYIQYALQKNHNPYL